MATPKLFLKKSMLVDFDSRQSENGNNSLGEVAGVRAITDWPTPVGTP